MSRRELLPPLSDASESKRTRAFSNPSSPTLPPNLKKGRNRPSLAIKQIDFSKLWKALKRDLYEILRDPLSAKPKHDTEQLHNIVYKLSTCQSYNLVEPSVLSLNPHANYVIPQDGDIQPHTLYFLLKRLISRFLRDEVIGKRLSGLSGITLLKQYAECWRNFTLSCDYINRIFHYLNTDWISEEENKQKNKYHDPRDSTTMKPLTHLSDSNYVCGIKNTCYLLWREWFFERCDDGRNQIDIGQLGAVYEQSNESTMEDDEEQPKSNKSFFNKYYLYRTLLHYIEMDRKSNNPTNFTNNVTSVDGFYPILKAVVESLVDLSLDSESDYYFVNKYKFYTNFDGFNTLNDVIGGYYTSVLEEKKKTSYDSHHHPLFYTLDFERFLLQSTHNFYVRECSGMISELRSIDVNQHPVYTYIRHVLLRLDQETNKMSLHFIHPSSKDVLNRLCIEILVEGMNVPSTTQLVTNPMSNNNMQPPSPTTPRLSLVDLNLNSASSLDFLLSELDTVWFENIDAHKKELQSLFKLVHKSHRKQAFTVYKEKFREKIVNDITHDIKSKLMSTDEDNYDPVVFIEIIIEKFIKFGNVVREIFHGNIEFMVAKDKGCKEVFNSPPIFTTNPSLRSAEFLARYTHHLMRSNYSQTGSKTLTDQEIEEKMDQCVSICGLLNDMDVFVQFYKQYLSRRLLLYRHDVGTQEELEVTMIQKLKRVCPFSQIYKIQTMLNDLNVAHNLNEQFKIAEKDKQKIHFSTTVLTRGYWPLHTASLMYPNENKNFILPSIISERIRDFTEFYSSQHSGRHLTWLNVLSKGVVRAHFANSNMPYFEFTVSVVQLSLLLPFNKNRSSSQEGNAIQWSVQDLMNETGLPFDEVVQALSPFLSVKLLNTQNQELSTSLKKTTMLEVNEHFSSKKNKLSLFQHSIKQYYDDGSKSKDNPLNQKIFAQVQEDRRYIIQAAIVRILKARKQMEHKQLVYLLYSQLSSNFKPTTPDIKRAIDSLLQQEYIKRVSEDSSWYQYIA